MDVREAIERLSALDRQKKKLNDASALLTWDLRICAPRGAISRRAELIGALAGDTFRIATGDELRRCLDVLENEEARCGLGRVQMSLVREARREYQRYANIPEDRYSSYTALKANAQAAWQEAKANNDFLSFFDYLEKIVEANRYFADRRGYDTHPYDVFLDDYESGMTTARLQDIFAVLKEHTLSLMRRIEENGREINAAPLRGHFDREKQAQLCRRLLHTIGFDLNRGRLDESEHPFTLGISAPDDVRLTTRYDEDDLTFAMLSTLHEGGHGIYEQGIAPELAATTLAAGASEGIHESQSRFFENMIGRSRAFWQAAFPGVKEVFPKELGSVSACDFSDTLNRVAPSLIRTEADELTYNLHIMLRFELEKGLLDGSYQVKHLPELWNGKMREYLGIEPPDDRSGVLQDIHWAAGAFGYFPSYALGNIYAAQFLNAMERDIPDLWQEVRVGHIQSAVQWLHTHIHCHGHVLTPDELLRSIAGEGIQPAYLTRYLDRKFSEIYGLKQAGDHRAEKEVLS